LSSVERIYIEGALTLFMVLRAGFADSWRSSVSVRCWWSGQSGINWFSLVRWAPSVHCNDHPELEQRPSSCRHRLLSQTRSSRDTIRAPGKKRSPKPLGDWYRVNEKGHSASSNCVTTSWSCVAYTQHKRRCHQCIADSHLE